MNVEYLIAAICSSILTVGHTYFGEVLFFKGIPASAYPATYFGDGDTTMRLMKNAWHFLGGSLLISAVVMYMLAFTNYFENPTQVAMVISGMHLIFTLVYFYYGLTKPIIIVRAPVWIGTAGTALFGWLGTF